MATILPYAYGFGAGAALVGAWWWWIYRKDKIRAAIKTVEGVGKTLK